MTLRSYELSISMRETLALDLEDISRIWINRPEGFSGDPASTEEMCIVSIRYKVSGATDTLRLTYDQASSLVNDFYRYIEV